MGMKFFISDTHLGHANIIRMNGRPFHDVTEMNETIINNWKSRVDGSDEVYFVGDFAFKIDVVKAIGFLERLPGRKHLIRGNHDAKYLSSPVIRELWESVEDLKIIDVDGEKVVLCHYPLAEWPGYYMGWYHIYGHIHNNDVSCSEYLSRQERALNAGVDINGFMPATLKELVRNNNFWRANYGKDFR
jgi:calcineurin-like phosphoesterase family protein